MKGYSQKFYRSRFNYFYLFRYHYTYIICLLWILYIFFSEISVYMLQPCVPFNFNLNFPPNVNFNFSQLRCEELLIRDLDD